MWKSSESVEKKTSVIGLPKFTTVNMAGKCHQHASFSIENLLFGITVLEAQCQIVFLAGSELSDQYLSSKG